MAERNADENGWASSAQSWMKRISEQRDFSREHILDHRMLDRALRTKPTKLLDIGCGEGRFCRILSAHGVAVTGIDPVPSFIDFARQQDPSGDYMTGFAETLPFDDAQFDLAVFYLSLLDIEGFAAAIGEAERVLMPGGIMLVANLTSFVTSNGNIGWIEAADGSRHFPLGNYLDSRGEWFEWDGLRIRNWHRPLSTYMTAFLDAGLQLTYFDEPAPVSGPKDRIERYHRAPWIMMMEWQKPKR